MENERRTVYEHIQAGHNHQYGQSAICHDPVIDTPGPDPSYGGLQTGYCDHDFGGKLRYTNKLSVLICRNFFFGFQG